MSEKKLSKKNSKGNSLSDDKLTNVVGGLGISDYCDTQCKYCNSYRVRLDKEKDKYYCDSCNSYFKK